MKNFIIYLLLVIILGLVIWDIFFREYPGPPPLINYEYVTDTIWDSIPYQVPKPYPVPTPPRIVTVYDSVALDSLKLTLQEKEILISGLEQQISIHQNFLKQYPNNPKLIHLSLFRDSLDIVFLPISGIIRAESWPIDLYRFRYRWDYVSGLSRIAETPLPPTKERALLQYFVGGGVDLLFMSPYISGRIETELFKFKLYGDLSVGLLDKNSSAIRLGIYRQIYDPSSN